MRIVFFWLIGLINVAVGFVMSPDWPIAFLCLGIGLGCLGIAAFETVKRLTRG